jgi:hypothetical protein
MSYIQIPDYVFNRILNTLQKGYDICDAVDYDSDETEKSPCYANGYSRATMRSVIEDLQQYKANSN